MTHRVYIDFETRSAADIKKVGGYAYAVDPSTEILCVAFSYDHLDGIQNYLCTPEDLRNPFGSEAKRLWKRAEGGDPEIVFIAHNAPFEQNIWREIMVKEFDFPELPVHRWRCTMAKALKHGLPGKLEKCAEALQLPVKKDMTGHKVMMKLSQPKSSRSICKAHGRSCPHEFWEWECCPEDFDDLYWYCKKDVEVERLIDQALQDLSPYEQRVWCIDQRMNQQGIHIDVDMIERAMRFGDRKQEDLKAEFYEITGIEGTTKRNQLITWSANNGCRIPNTQAATIRNVLVRDGLPTQVRQAFTVLQQAGKSALAKYPAFMQRSVNGVIRETLQYHGAHTGRWAGRGVQVQNMKRPTIDIPTCIDALMNHTYETFDMLYSDPLEALGSCVRGAIVAPEGQDLFVADYGQIESRTLAWLAGQQDKLDKFAAGVDMYCSIASAIYGRGITKADKDERQVGKVSDLAFGYQGGIAAGQNMGKGYGVDFDGLAGPILRSATFAEKERAEYCYMLYLKNDPEEPVSRDAGYAINILKDRWRAAHPLIVQYWNDLENAAIRAVESGEPQTVGSIKFFMHKQFLVCKLPSGRPIFYPYPRVETGKRGKQVLTYRTEFNGQWIRTSTYGGSLAENITQAVCRDIMVGAMVRCEDAGYPWIFHAHDEGIAQRIGGDLEEFLDLMRGPQPKWATGIPIKVEGWKGKRYGK